MLSFNELANKQDALITAFLDFLFSIKVFAKLQVRLAVAYKKNTGQKGEATHSIGFLSFTFLKIGPNPIRSVWTKRVLSS